MPYRHLFEVEPERVRERAREALVRLADEGSRRSWRGDRPREPPRRASSVTPAFPIVEDAANPLNEQPGMTNVVLIRVGVRLSSVEEVELVRRAVWSVHPLFETWYWPISNGVPVAVVEVPGSKIAGVGAWISVVIERVLPVLHAYCPIESVRFGREPRST